MTVLFVVVYQLAARVLSPWVMSRAVHLRPLIIIVATVAGAVLGGVVGALVAVSVVAVLKVVAAFVYKHLAPRSTVRLTGQRIRSAPDTKSALGSIPPGLACSLS